MVSQPEPTLSVISPSSYPSYDQSSWTGDPSENSRDEFPMFNDTGDVEILLVMGGQTDRYLLHRLILVQCSKFFDFCSNEKNKEIPDIGGKRRWYYELNMRDGLHNNPVLVLRQDAIQNPIETQSPPPVKNKPGHPYLSVPLGNFFQCSPPSPSYLGKETVSDLRQAYRNLFLIFYNYPPDLHLTSLSRAYLESKILLHLADLYNALSVVGPRVDHHLLRFQSALWKHIAKYPTSYLRLGYLTKSKHIFQEAFVHALGRWSLLGNYIRERLPSCVTQLIEEKSRDLRELVRGVESELWNLTLYTSSGKRVTPQNSYLDWLVVSFFREWLANCSRTSPTFSYLTQSTRSTGIQTITYTTKTKGTKGTKPQRQQAILLENDILSLTQNAQDQTLSMAPSQITQQPFNIIPPISLLTIGHSTSSAPTYLGHHQCKDFLKLNEPYYTRDNLKYFEQRLDELRALAREKVKPVIESKLNCGAQTQDYLVCVGIGVEEWPWAK